MGYYTNYTLKVVNAEPEDIRQPLKEISGYIGWYTYGRKICLSEAKWYDHKDDMIRLSKMFPDVKFELHGAGEDGDQWMIYALNGQIENCPGRMEFAKRTLW